MLVFPVEPPNPSITPLKITLNRKISTTQLTMPPTIEKIHFRSDNKFIVILSWQLRSLIFYVVHFKPLKLEKTLLFQGCFDTISSYSPSLTHDTVLDCHTSHPLPLPTTDSKHTPSPLQSLIDNMTSI